ncbi:MAG: c-type cytochrome [Pseudomonadota bacterium]
MPLLPLLILLPALLGAPLAQAQAGPEALRQQALAATCANCHGSEGRAIADSVVPGLAGQPAPFLVDTLKAFKRGERQATVMHQIAKGYSDAQLDALAAYFAARPR